MTAPTDNTPPRELAGDELVKRHGTAVDEHIDAICWAVQ